MIFLTFLFVLKKSFVVQSMILRKKFLEYIKTCYSVPSELETFSWQQKHFLFWAVCCLLSYLSPFPLQVCRCHLPLLLMLETLYATTIILTFFFQKATLQIDPMLYSFPKYLCLRHFIEKFTSESKKEFAHIDAFVHVDACWMEYKMIIRSEACPKGQLSYNEAWNRLN